MTQRGERDLAIPTPGGLDPSPLHIRTAGKSSSRGSFFSLCESWAPVVRNLSAVLHAAPYLLKDRKVS